MACKTLKEALLKSLEEIDSGTATEVYRHIAKMQYYEFGGKTPEATVQAQLGEFIRQGDARVKRAKNDGKVYRYYLTKNEDAVESSPIFNETTSKKDRTTYKERDLHPLLCTFLNAKYNIQAKTIFHEQSSKHEEAKWTHPDIIGVKFIKYNNEACQQLFKVTNRTNTADIYSYELKKEINTDYELKKYYFQAVSNSSWANYGFLVALDIGENLHDELERLNQSFGIGVIQLDANPYKSRILFPSKRRDIEFKTMNKLCNLNKDFQKFIGQIEKMLTAEPKYVDDVLLSMKKFCDEPFANEEKAEEYCKEKHIPLPDKDVSGE